MPFLFDRCDGDSVDGWGSNPSSHGTTYPHTKSDSSSSAFFKKSFGMTERESCFFFNSGKKAEETPMPHVLSWNPIFKSFFVDLLDPRILHGEAPSHALACLHNRISSSSKWAAVDHSSNLYFKTSHTLAHGVRTVPGPLLTEVTDSQKGKKTYFNSFF